MSAAWLSATWLSALCPLGVPPAAESVGAAAGACLLHAPLAAAGACFLHAADEEAAADCLLHAAEAARAGGAAPCTGRSAAGACAKAPVAAVATAVEGLRTVGMHFGSSLLASSSCLVPVSIGPERHAERRLPSAAPRLGGGPPAGAAASGGGWPPCVIGRRRPAVTRRVLGE